jgi:hypothetical protein
MTRVPFHSRLQAIAGVSTEPDSTDGGYYALAEVDAYTSAGKCTTSYTAGQ